MIHYLSLFFIKHRRRIIIGTAILAILFGITGFILSDITNGWSVINNTIALFAMEYAEDNSIFLDIAKSLAIISVSFAAFTVFFSDTINGWAARSIQKNKYDLVIGLGSQNQHFLESSENRTRSTLVIEVDKTNVAIETFRKKGFCLIIDKAENVIDTLDLAKLEKCIIATGNDRLNIVLCMQILEDLDEKQNQVIYVRIEHRELSVLFLQQVLGNSNTKFIDIIPYSLYQNISKQLFSEHSILGLQRGIIETDQVFNIILVGSSELATEIIYDLAILSNLPEQNKLTIYCIDKQADTFCTKVEKLFPGIGKIPHLTLKTVNLDADSLKFYTDSVWQAENLTNIIIATDNEDNNLDIAVNLQDTTYIKETTTTNMFKTNILFAIFDNKGLGKKIDEDKDYFSNFYSFGSHASASSRDNLFNEKIDMVAKLINYDYTEEVDFDSEALHQKWYESTSLHDRESCKAQASHIDIKLLALGLQKKAEPSLEVSKLLENNQKILDENITDRNVTNDMLENYTHEYFPNSFETLFDKIVRSEHDRWNAFHYLQGWQYNEVKNKPAKQHDCLMPFEGFRTQNAKESYRYDIYSLLYIPKYLAHAGYEIVPTDQVGKS